MFIYLLYAIDKEMLVIKGLRVIVAPKSFECFNNMFRTVESQEFDNNYTSAYIAILVYDKIVLEGNPIRANEVNTWFNGGWYPKQRRNVFDRNIDEEYLSNIID